MPGFHSCVAGFIGTDCGPIGWVKDQIGGVIGDVAKDAGNSVFEAVAGFFGNAAAAMLNWLWGALDDITSINLGSPNVRDMLGLTLALGFVVALLLAAIEIAVSALYKRPRGVVTAITGLAKTTVGTIAAVSTTQIMLTCIDEICRGFVHVVLGQSTVGLGEAMGITAAFSAMNPAGALVMAIAAMFAVAIIFVAMIFRSTLIILAAVLTPLALAGSSSSWTQSWPRKWVEWMVALVISKLLLVIIMVLGVKIVLNPSLNGGSWLNNVATFGGGVAMLLLAGFSPWIAIKLVHFTEGHISAVAGQAGALAGPFNKAKDMAKSAAMTAATAGAGGAGGGAAKVAAGETVVGTAEAGAGASGAAGGGGTMPPETGGSGSDGAGDPSDPSTPTNTSGGGGATPPFDEAGSEADPMSGTAAPKPTSDMPKANPSGESGSDNNGGSAPVGSPSSASSATAAKADAGAGGGASAGSLSGGSGASGSNSAGSPNSGANRGGSAVSGSPQSAPSAQVASPVRGGGAAPRSGASSSVSSASGGAASRRSAPAPASPGSSGGPAPLTRPGVSSPRASAGLPPAPGASVPSAPVAPVGANAWVDDEPPYLPPNAPDLPPPLSTSKSWVNEGGDQ